MKMAKILKAVASAFVAGALAATAMFSAVSASTQTADLTITGTNENHSYEAYQIFAGDLEGSTLSNIVWGSGVDGDSLLIDLQSQTDLGGVDYSLVTSAAEVAELLATYGSGYNSTAAQAFADFISEYLSDTCATATVAAGDTTATFTGIEVGYYLVKDSDGSLDDKDEAYTRFIIKIVGDANAAVKSSTPTVDKQVYDDDDSAAGWNDVADYDIGDAVPFKLTGSMPSTLGDYETYTYIFHDTLSGGLTLDVDSIVVKIDGVEIDSSAYTVETGEDTCGCTFEVAFTDIISAAANNSKEVTLSTTSQVVVTYNATLNSNAVIGLNGNPNEVYLEYSNNPNQGGEGDTGSTPEEYALVFTYELDVTKVDGEDSTITLEGAEFVLYDENNNYVIVDKNGKVTSWTKDLESASTLKSNENGNFVVSGLDEGTYYLKETKAPAGYNLLSGYVTLVIDATDVHTVEYDGANASEELTALKITVDGTEANGTTSTGIVEATIKNNSGSVLPETGGIGTTIFYVGGAILVVGAVVLLIVKRRIKTAE